MPEQYKPKPFSTEWLTAAKKPARPPRRVPERFSQRFIAAASRLPGERALAMMVVMVLVISSFWFSGPRGEAHTTDQEARLAALAPMPTIEFANVEPTSEATISTESLTIADPDEEDAGSEADRPEGVDSQTVTAPKLNLQQTEAQSNTSDGLLPEHRILTYYGFPTNDQMGILGEYDKEGALELLQEQAAEYEEADPSRPVLIAFEVIASVAQGEPQPDGSYILDAPTDMLDEYAEFTAENDMLLFLDVQIGRRTVAEDIEGLRPWLKQPHVHLALDPEFAMREGEVPGVQIGQVTAEDVTYTQNWLVEVAEEAGVPPKVLIVHQFHHSMIEQKEQIEPVEGVQLVIDMDGWGPPDMKRETYNAVITQEPIEFNGVKLFYQQDDPLMTAEEVLALEPSPDLIIYQ